MNIKWNREGNDLEYQGIHFQVSCKVRNDIDANYIRRLHDPKEVIYALYNGEFEKDKPYMPRKFPKGLWKILSVEVNPGSEFSGLPGFTTVSEANRFKESDYGQVKIRTNAKQEVFIWKLDAKGGYDVATKQTTMDEGYLLHSSDWVTSWGCGIAATGKQIKKLGCLVAAQLAKSDVFLEVV
jgi:hypothetical protein